MWCSPNGLLLWSVERKMECSRTGCIILKRSDFKFVLHLPAFANDILKNLNLFLPLEDVDNEGTYFKGLLERKERDNRRRYLAQMNIKMPINILHPY